MSLPDLARRDRRATARTTRALVTGFILGALVATAVTGALLAISDGLPG